MRFLGFIKQVLNVNTKAANHVQVKGKQCGLMLSLIPKRAIYITEKLQANGFSAYLVGGCVRDLLLQREPKDFDIATNARPEQIKRLFNRCYLVGRRFRIAHIRFGRDVYEVSTFRGHETKQSEDKSKPVGREHSEHGMILDDNVYGTLEEDAFRRDFTVNALYYNPADDMLIDHTGGLTDIKQKLLRMIGEPAARYREDPVRILRVLRFSAKLHLNIDPLTLAPIHDSKSLLLHISPARLFLEIEKIIRSGASADCYQHLKKHHIFSLLFEEVAAYMENDEGGDADKLLTCLFQNTDTRIRAGKTTTPAFFLAGLLWFLQQDLSLQYRKDYPEVIASDIASDEVFEGVLKQFSVPKRFVNRTKEIWTLQILLQRRRGKQPLRLLEHSCFRAAYDFLLLRAQIHDHLQELAAWWTTFQDVTLPERKHMLRQVQKREARRKHRKHNKHHHTPKDSE